MMRKPVPGQIPTELHPEAAQVTKTSAMLIPAGLLAACALAGEADWNDHMAQARDIYMKRWCDARSNLLYGVRGDDADRDRGLPKPDAVRQQQPDYRGYGTAMSDTALFGGKVLAAFCDAFDATGDERIRTQARRLFKGLTFMMTVTREKGFVPRGPHPADPHAYYKDSSGDQHWMWMFGMWRYHRSKLATAEDKKLIAQLMREVVMRFERNGWRNLNEDNTKPAWADGGHLIRPMYAVGFLSLLAMAHETTGDAKWGELYQDACAENRGARLKFIRDKLDVAPHNIYQPEQTSNKLFALAAYDLDPARREIFDHVRQKQARLALDAKFPALLVGSHRPRYVEGEADACGDKLILNGAFEWRAKLDEDLLYHRGKWSQCSVMYALHHIRTVVRWPLIAFNVAMRCGDPELARRAGAEAKAIIGKVDWDYRYVKWDTQTRAIVAGSLLQGHGDF